MALALTPLHSLFMLGKVFGDLVLRTGGESRRSVESEDEGPSEYCHALWFFNVPPLNHLGGRLRAPQRTAQRPGAVARVTGLPFRVQRRQAGQHGDGLIVPVEFSVVHSAFRLLVEQGPHEVRGIVRVRERGASALSKAANTPVRFFLVAG